MHRLWATLLLVLMLAACTDRHTSPSPNSSPVPADSVFVLNNGTELAVLNPTSLELTQRIPLGRRALTYARFEQKLLIPLVDDQGDTESYLAILDLETGVLRKVSARLGGMNGIHVTAGGIAYITTGTNIGPGFEFLVGRFDARTETFLEPLRVPGNPGLITSLGDGRLLIPIRRQDGSGNVYEYQSNDGSLVPFLPAPMEPSSPPLLLADEAKGLLYTLWPGLPKGTSVWEFWRERVSDPRLVDSHIAVYDLASRTLVRRIYLPHLSAQQIAFMPDGRIVVGYLDLTQKNPVGAFSVVDATDGSVKDVPAWGNPHSVRVQGDRVYVANDRDNKLEAFQLADLGHPASIIMSTRPLLPMDTNSRR